MKAIRKVELVTIGDELLNGIRANGHLLHLGKVLEERGLPLLRSSELRDQPEGLLSGIREALARSDLVVLTGGLGPTSDDNTAACAAAALARPLVHNSLVEEDIRAFFKERGRELTENNLKQCLIIEGAEVLQNSNGTAPGQWLDTGDQVVVLLPGPPHELNPILEEQVLPRLESKGWVHAMAEPVQLRCIGIGESKVANMLTPLLAGAGDKIQVAYCAHPGFVDIRLSTVEGGWDEVKVRALGELCRERLGEAFLGYGTPDPACVILQQLRCLGKSLAVAESCTGGLLASRFTDVPGASKVFKGGVVCYLNSVKEHLLNIPGCLIEQHGAVSAECAVAMATGVAELMESDYALSITGYAGPEAGDEPAGTIYLGYHSPVGVWSCRVSLPGTRTAVKERAVLMALDFIRRKLEKYKVYDLLESLKC
ncbi:MAG: CinA family nicotinamide mononucleotide deamidase-related protein [Opitutales bacterium]|jgi:nicotinamide-nucleotide amidase